MTFITFGTVIKICRGYEFLKTSIQQYVDCIEYHCEKYGISYEILIAEDICSKNIERITVSGKNVRILECPQTYPNPRGYNMLESYGKNMCMRNASGKFLCLNSADVLFSNMFFWYIKHHLIEKIFYRFATYEVPHFDTNIPMQKLVEECNIRKKRLCNPGCFVQSPNAIQLGQKSGDIMLMDTHSFNKIAWQENGCFHHVDLTVCILAQKQFKVCVAPLAMCTYTFEQKDRKISETEQEEYQIALSYLNDN